MNNKELLIQSALEYHHKGFNIIPLKENKTPAIATWNSEIKTFTTEEEIIKTFQNKTIQGVGITTGPLSDIFVLDVDQSIIFFEWLKDNNLTMPDTLTALTPKKRGYHYYFKWTKDAEITNKKKLLNDAVDIKGKGGYVVAPPSFFYEKIIDKKTKEEKEISGYYKWQENLGLNEIEIAEAPKWLLNEIFKFNQQDSFSKNNFTDIIFGVEEGKRDNSAVSIVGFLIQDLRESSWETTAWNTMLLWNEKDNPPMDLRDLRKCFISICDRERRRRQNNGQMLSEPIIFKEFLETKYPETKWIIENLIPYAGITIISAPPEHFKTWLLLEMAISLAQNKDFLGFKTQQNKVLFINEENWEGHIQERIRLLTTIQELPVYFYHNQNIKINEVKIEEILAFCQKYGIKVVVIDSLIRVHDLDENSSKDMDFLFNLFKKLTNKEITLIITHHNRKQGMFESPKARLEKMRGSGNIGAQIDCNLAILQEQNYLILSQVKLRIAKKIGDLRIEMKEIDNKITFENLGNTDKDRIDKETNRNTILTLIENSPGITRMEIMDKGKISNRTTQEHLIDLEEAGEIYSQGKKPKRFYLSKFRNMNELL